MFLSFQKLNYNALFNQFCFYPKIKITSQLDFTWRSEKIG